MFVYEPEFAKQLRQLQQTYMDDSDRLDRKPGRVDRSAIDFWRTRFVWSVRCCSTALGVRSIDSILSALSVATSNNPVFDASVGDLTT